MFGHAAARGMPRKSLKSWQWMSCPAPRIYAGPDDAQPTAWQETLSLWPAEMCLTILRTHHTHRWLISAGQMRRTNLLDRWGQSATRICLHAGQMLVTQMHSDALRYFQMLLSHMLSLRCFAGPSASQKLLANVVQRDDQNIKNDFQIHNKNF